MSSPDPVLIAGSGAMACLFAARLASAGAPITMLGTWREGLQAIRQHGVRWIQPSGEEAAFPVKVVSSPEGCAGVRSALVLVKSYQSERVASMLAECLHPEGTALTLQNGLGNDDILAKHLGEERTYQGVTTAGANLAAPGLVRSAGEGKVYLLEHAKMVPFAELLRAAGFMVGLVPEMRSLLWSKLVINAAINPLTALLGVPNGELLSRPAARELMTSAAVEAASVAAALGVNLTYADASAAVEAVARDTAANRSSMLGDVQRGSQTEIEAINGAVLRAGETAGVDTSTNRTLYLLVKALSSQQADNSGQNS